MTAVDTDHDELFFSKDSGWFVLDEITNFQVAHLHKVLDLRHIIRGHTRLYCTLKRALWRDRNAQPDKARELVFFLDYYQTANHTQMNNLRLAETGTILYKIGEKFVHNLWPKAIFPGADSSMTLQLVVTLLGITFLWTAIQSIFVKEGDGDFVSGTEDEYYTGEELGYTQPSLMDSLSNMLGDVLGAVTAKPPAKPSSASHADKVIANKASTAAKKAYKKPFIHRLVLNAIYFYVLTLIIMQVASLQYSETKWLTASSLSASYFANRRSKYIPYNGTSYRPSYRSS